MEEYLKIKLYQFFDEDISIKEFEDWIYKNSEKLEHEISKEFHLDLISFNFKSKYAKQEFFKTFDEKLDWKDYEERRLYRILDSIINKDENFAKDLIKTYDLRNNGYWFLEDLGMTYALNLITGYEYGILSWEEFPKVEKEKLIEENFLGAKESAIQVKNWLKNNLIILTGKKESEFNKYIFIDNRRKDDLSNGEYEWTFAIEQSEKVEYKTSSKKWWEIWKK